MTTESAKSGWVPQNQHHDEKLSPRQTPHGGEKSTAADAETSRSCCASFLAWDGSLAILSLVGAGVGFAIGFTLYYVGASPTALVWVGLPGELYMQMLKAAVLPLIISSIISGTAGLKPKENGRVSAVALTYIIITNIIGAVVGTLLAVIVQPGSHAARMDNSTTVDTGHLQTSDLFADLIRNLFPDNVVSACFEKVQTHYKQSGEGNTTSFERYLSSAGGTNILGLVIVCAAVGMAAAQAGDVAQPFLKFFHSAAEVIIRLIQWVIWLTPLGVASLIAKAIGSTKDVEATFKGLGLFVLAEVVGNVFLAFILVPLLYLVFLRKNPFVFLATASRSIITGAASASSAVAMPEIINCVETKHHVDVRVSRFVIPLAAAINRDGSGMFIALTSVYMAQLQSFDTANNIILIAILASVGSLAIPGVPSASIVTILMILSSLEIPPANIGIIIALEWFSDRMRAVPNMVSHVLCGVLTWHLCKASLRFESDPSALEEPHQEVINMDTKPQADGEAHHEGSVRL